MRTILFIFFSLVKPVKGEKMKRTSKVLKAPCLNEFFIKSAQIPNLLANASIEVLPGIKICFLKGVVWPEGKVTAVFIGKKGWIHLSNSRVNLASDTLVRVQVSKKRDAGKPPTSLAFLPQQISY